MIDGDEIKDGNLGRLGGADPLETLPALAGVSGGSGEAGDDGFTFDEVLGLLEHLDGLLGHGRCTGLAKESHPKVRACWEAREAARIARALQAPAVAPETTAED